MKFVALVLARWTKFIKNKKSNDLKSAAISARQIRILNHTMIVINAKSSVFMPLQVDDRPFIFILGYNYVTCRPVSTYWVSSVHGRQSKKYTQNVK